LVLSLFVGLQGVRLWILATLGPRWTTRIIVLPGAPLVTSGPYRYSSHPNYAVVAAEIALLLPRCISAGAGLHGTERCRARQSEFVPRPARSRPSTVSLRAGVS
jgi:hypothetical protein